MKQYKDRAIVLSRVDYGESDRILTLLTKNHGKISVLAKSVRAQKSRLAGGIELMSESDIIFITGRSEIKTLTSARLLTHYANIVKHPKKLKLAYDYLKIINKITERDTGQEFYVFLATAFNSLDSESLDERIVDVWVGLHILRLSGSAPNLRVAETAEAVNFEFDYDLQQFKSRQGGAFTQNDLKLLRLCITQSKPPKIQNDLDTLDRLQSLVRSLLTFNVTEV